MSLKCDSGILCKNQIFVNIYFTEIKFTEINELSWALLYSYTFPEIKYCRVKIKKIVVLQNNGYFLNYGITCTMCTFTDIHVHVCIVVSQLVALSLCMYNYIVYKCRSSVSH